MIQGSYVVGGTTYNIDQDYTKGIQKTLSEKLAVDMTIDGNFGPTSIGYLKQYQLKRGLPGTGQYDANTQGVIEPFLLTKYVTLKDFKAAAVALGVSVAAIKAVQETETSGSGFLYTGRPKILFERHWFYRFLQKKLTQNQLGAVYAKNSDICNPTPGGYATGPTLGARGVGEWSRFNRAFAIDPASALLSASWGLFQTMGFNAHLAGFANADKSPNAGAMVEAFKVSEMNQLAGFVQYIMHANGGGLWTAMKTRDWVKFASLYNGSGDVAEYSTKMGSNFSTFASNALYA